VQFFTLLSSVGFSAQGRPERQKLSANKETATRSVSALGPQTPAGNQGTATSGCRLGNTTVEAGADVWVLLWAGATVEAAVDIVEAAGAAEDVAASAVAVMPVELLASALALSAAWVMVAAELEEEALLLVRRASLASPQEHSRATSAKADRCFTLPPKNDFEPSVL
jgi:hypothetical protein